MEKITLFEIPALYRDDFRITGYCFGGGEKSLALVGSLRGDECQQIYMCSLLVNRLKELEKEGKIAEDKEIMILPSLNPYSMNIGKRFWPTDNTDINRMFPGYALGETTQRIAAAVFDEISQYQYGIQFASSYMAGHYQPHVHIMKTGFENIESANDFGLPYIYLRNPRPFDTTTLNYNWQIWETEAYSLYSTTTKELDEEGAKLVVEGVLRFMAARGLIKEEYPSVEPATLLRNENLVSIRPSTAGLFHALVSVGQEVKKGEPVARIRNTYEGDILEELTAPADGRVFFLHGDPLTYANNAVCKLICEK